MKQNRKTIYEEPQMTVLCFDARDIITTSAGGFLSEDDLLDKEQTGGINIPVSSGS